MDEFITNINQLNLSQTHLDLQDELDSIIRQEPAHATEDLVPIHPGMSRVSHTNIRSSSISSNSPAPTSSSSASTSTSNSSNPTEVSPSPPTFPPHILNILLNRLLTEPRYLTHPNLCHIRQIARTTDAAAAFVGNFLYNNRRFHRELETAFLGPYRDAQRGRRVPLNMLVPIFGWPNEEPDVITGAILDDCPGCFEWIRRRLPRMDCYGCNLFGWTYVAIAVHARSIGILEYLFAWDKPVGAMDAVLRMRANAFQMSDGPTPVALAVREGDVGFLECLLNLWEPCIERSVGRERTGMHREGPRRRNCLSEVDAYFLCTFVTGELAGRLAGVGLPIYDTVLEDLGRSRSGFTRLATAWHAAVFNGPSFLEYLEAHSNVSKLDLDANGESPLHYAKRANRDDSVIWLKQHGGVLTGRPR